MNKEEQIRAKALELAILSFGTEKIPFSTRETEDGKLPASLARRVELIETFIRDGFRAER
jgi:hypothetical protein